MAGRVGGLVGLIIGVIAGCAEYYWGDHWLYVNGGNQYLYPPTWVNVASSAVFGAVMGGAVWLLLALTRWTWRRIRPKPSA